MAAVTGGSSSINQNTTQQTQFTPEDQSKIYGSRNALLDSVTNQRAAGSNLANQMAGQQVNLGRDFRTANLNTEFAGPQFSQGLDTTSRNLVAGEIGNRQAALQRQQQGIAQQFGGRSPGLARVLQAQNAGQQRLANNPLAFQAFQNQFGREAAQYGLGQQAQGMTNQARSAQAQQANEALGMANQAQLQQQGGNLGALQSAFGARQGLVGNEGNLLTQLLGLGQAFGQQSGGSSQGNEQGSGLADHLKHGGTIGKLLGR